MQLLMKQENLVYIRYVLFIWKQKCVKWIWPKVQKIKVIIGIKDISYSEFEALVVHSLLGRFLAKEEKVEILIGWIQGDGSKF